MEGGGDGRRGILQSPRVCKQRPTSANRLSYLESSIGQTLRFDLLAVSDAACAR